MWEIGTITMVMIRKNKSDACLADAELRRAARH